MAGRRGVRGGGSVARIGNSWRLRWWSGGKHCSKTIKGTRLDAVRELRRIVDGESVAPSRMTVSQWITQWLALKQRGVKTSTHERYKANLARYVEPVIGNMSLQRVTPLDIDRVYGALTLAPASAMLLHTIVKAAFRAAVKKKLITANPVDAAEKPGGKVEIEEADVEADAAVLTALVEAFRGHTSLFPLVAVAAGTGMRRGELLALQWPAIDWVTKTIHVVKNIEITRHGLRMTTPKSRRSRRSFLVDDGTLAVLRQVREQQQRIVAGTPDGDTADMAATPLPAGTLVFPAVGRDLTAIRHPDGVTGMFRTWARARGFDVHFHAIRAGHETALLDGGVPIHVVAARCGHDPAVLLRRYARRTARNDALAAGVIGGIMVRALGAANDDLVTGDTETANLPRENANS